MALHRVGIRFAMAKNNIPRHVGFIPDGNRRWAMDHGLSKEAGYAHGIDPGLLLYEKCKDCGIEEASIYCFTQDNTKRPGIQRGLRCIRFRDCTPWSGSACCRR